MEILVLGGVHLRETLFEGLFEGLVYPYWPLLQYCSIKGRKKTKRNSQKLTKSFKNSEYILMLFGLFDDEISVKKGQCLKKTPFLSFFWTDDHLKKHPWTDTQLTHNIVSTFIWRYMDVMNVETNVGCQYGKRVLLKQL